MKIEFTSFGDAGNIEDERIGFRVLESCDLKFFAVYHTRKTENGFYNRPKHVFWFYPKVHFLYWGLEDSIIKEGDCIVISEISDWSVHVCGG